MARKDGRRVLMVLATRAEMGEVEITATRPSRDSVLAVHAKLVAGGLDRRSGWTVTHVPSGKSVGVVFPTRRQAMALALEFGERTEWSAVGPRGGARNVDRGFARELMSAARRIAGISR